METTYIYTLSDPITNEIRYVGKSNNPRKRLFDHIKEANTGKSISHKNCWIKSLNGLKPIIEVIDEVPISEWESYEEYWISQLRYWGFNLTNLSYGGSGGNSYKRSDITKQKMGKSRLNVPLSEEHKKCISDGVKRKVKESPNYNKCYDKTYFLDKDLLYQKYIVENLSMPKLSKLLGVSEKVVFSSLKEFGIKKDKSIWVKQCANGNIKSVNQLDINRNFVNLFTSIKEASDKTGTNDTSITMCCKGKQKTAGGFIWEYN